MEAPSLRPHRPSLPWTDFRPYIAFGPTHSPRPTATSHGRRLTSGCFSRLPSFPRGCQGLGRFKNPALANTHGLPADCELHTNCAQGPDYLPAAATPSLPARAFSWGLESWLTPGPGLERAPPPAPAGHLRRLLTCAHPAPASLPSLSVWGGACCRIYWRPPTPPGAGTRLSPLPSQKEPDAESTSQTVSAPPLAPPPASHTQPGGHV